MDLKDSRFAKNYPHAYNKLAELEEKLDSHEDDIKSIYGDVYTQADMELEEKLNNFVSSFVMADEEIRTMVWTLEERLDDNRRVIDVIVDDLANYVRYVKKNRERLDELEASYSSKIWNIKLEARLRKLEGLHRSLRTGKLIHDYQEEARR